MKRILLLFSTLMLSCIALWAHDVEIDGIYYNLNETKKTAEVTYYGDNNDYDDEYSGSVTIPETITYNSEIYSVTSVGDEAFYNCSGLTSVTIPNSVTTIGEYAFEGCSGLSTVTIPNSVTHIDYNAFYNTGIYNNISNWDNRVLYIDNCLIEASEIVKGSYTIKEGTRIIGNWAFIFCSGLTSVTIPNSVTSIGDEAFRGLSGLTSVTIPNSVTSIGSSAFAGCSGLTSVTIGNSVTSIGENAFYGCSGLTKVNYLGTVDEWTEIDFFDNPTYYAEDLYINGELLTDVKIISADSIKRDAFTHCKSIKSVEIGNSVTSIGGYAFSYCSGLTSVTIGNNVTSIGYNAFSGCSGLSTVTIPNSVISIGYNAFYHCSGLTSVSIGNNVTSIGGGAFSCCSGLTSISIPKSVTSIGYGEYSGGCAFYGCSSLTSVVWNARNCANFEDEESSPFYNEKGANITSFTIGDDVETIPSYLCNNLVNLKNLIIGRNINSIGNYAFEGCKNLESITIFNEKVPMASNNSFDNYDANLYVLCDAYADYYFDNIFGDFKVQCIEADKIENISKIDVDIDENNNVIISWPSEFGAENYELIISKNIESIKQYNFDSKGQLLSIDSNYRSAQVGYSFTVTGLDSGNKYNYKVIALDKNGNILKEYVGEFALKEIVEIIENLADANISIIDGLITIADTDFSIYNISGQDVTSYNGNLSPGVYIIKNEEIITKVMIR